MADKKQVEIHRDSTNSILGFWALSDGATLLVVMDEGGYSGVHVSMDEWIKIREKLDGLFNDQTPI